MPHSERRYTEKGAPVNPLTGKWIMKLEFQNKGAEGWPHWHGVIDWPTKIPVQVLTTCWGRGFTWVNRYTKIRGHYFAKYIGSSDDMPAWLFGERCRSVKIIRTSPGFWNRSSRVSNQIEKKDKPHVYVPIGQWLSEEAETVVRDTQTCQYHRVRMPFNSAVLELAGEKRLLSKRGSWWVVSGSLESIVCILASRETGRVRGADPPLHLTETSNPHPAWFAKYLESMGEAEWEVVSGCCAV